MVSVCKRKRVKITQTSCSGYSETHERLQGVTRASQTPAQETLRSRNDTASSADRGICGKDLHCSQKPMTCQAGLKPRALLDCSFDAENPQSRKIHLNVAEGPQSALPKTFSPRMRAEGFREGSTCNQGVGLGLGLGLGGKHRQTCKGAAEGRGWLKDCVRTVVGSVGTGCRLFSWSDTKHIVQVLQN